MISIGSAAGCVSVTLGHLSDACSWHRSRLERVALTGACSSHRCGRKGETGCGWCVGGNVSVEWDHLLVKRPGSLSPARTQLPGVRVVLIVPSIHTAGIPTSERLETNFVPNMSPPLSLAGLVCGAHLFHQNLNDRKSLGSSDTNLV